MEITIKPIAHDEFMAFCRQIKLFDYDNPHKYSDYHIMKVVGERNGVPYTDYHVAFRWDGNEGWTNFARLWNYGGKWHINTTMRDEKFRFERVCERAGVKPYRNYNNFTEAAKDYIKIIKADNERFNERFNNK